MERYDPQQIEAKWQRVWEDERAFHEPNPAPGEDADERHWYQLEMLPYPSGSLHMGHVLNYTMGDVQTHLRRRSGWRVLRPMGFDSFGLPAENAALRDGEHPRKSTERYIVLMREQMKRLGWAIDWDREVSAHQPEFYRWTQWLFLKFFERGLAYRKAAPVNWCPNDQTVVANEYVIDGRCERCGAEVEARNLEQWFFKITDYADELLEYDLPPGGEWPERTKTIQRNWIGRSEGAEILFRIDELGEDVPVFTTRPDTLFGATFFVLAPEHPLVERIGNDEVRAYAKQTAARRGEERAAQEVKTGVFTGLHAINPVNGERLPVYVADYVLMEYGTGAIMAVPAHDERDREFAEAFGLPIVEVVTEEGELVNSGEFDGMSADEGRKAIVESLREEGKAKPTVSYRLRDWSFSRQRYWGSPIPIVYCDDCGIVPVPDDELPVLLPEVEDYRPKGVAPLASNTEWLHVPCPRCGKPATREADTMDTFVDSSWYFLRYVDPHSDVAPFDRAAADYWCPIAQYIGGIDHATGHLLYSRFFVKVMNEMGLVGFREPFASVFHQGWVQLGGTKMSKSKGNVEGPDELVRLHGADAVRLYILFLGPADQDMEWTPAGVGGHRTVPAPAVAARARGGRGRRRRRPGRHAARAQGSRDDREGHRRHRAAPVVQHRHRRDHGARQRAVARHRRSGRTVRRRDRRQPHPALRTAHWRGAVGRPGARAALGGAVAGGGRGDARARDVRARRPGQRPCPRSRRGCGVALRRRAGRARQGLGEGAGASRRQGDPPGDRRPAQARELRRLKPNRPREGADT